MTTMTTGLPSRPLTRSDLENLPEDGHRHELIDGTLIMSPAPGLRHQNAVIGLLDALRVSCPPHLTVLIAPFAVGLSDDTEVQPDVLVARRSDLTEKDLPAPPVLAVEVLSPSSRSIDLLLKRERYERAGIPSYWIIDPHEPSITCSELDHDGHFRQVAHAIGDQTATLTTPYDVDVTPSALVD